MPEKDFRFSRTVFCESSDGEPVNSDLRDPFSNIKIEIVNVPPPSSKRQLDDSFLEESFKTPLKKHFILSPFFSTPDEHPASSPGLACVLDPCDSLPVGHTFKSSSGSAQQKRKRSCDENFTCIGSKSSNLICVVDPGAGLLKRLGSTQGGELEPSSSRDAQAKKSFCPISVQSEKNRCGEQPQIVSKEPEFDFDIDELLSLSPIECRSPYQGIEELIENCHSFYEEGSSGKLGGEDLESCRVSCTKKEAQQIDGSKQCPDRGYFSKSYHEDLEHISDDLKNHPLAPLHLMSSSSPIKLETTKVDFEKPCVSAGVRHGGEIQVNIKSAPSVNAFQNEVSVCKNVILLGTEDNTDDDDALNIGAPEHQSSVCINVLETEDISTTDNNIGLPVHESSVCEVLKLQEALDCAVNVSASGTESSVRTSLTLQESEVAVTDDDSLNITQLDVKVRSVVVFPQKRKEAYAEKAGKKEDKVGIINPFSRKEREVMFKDTELERRKEMYLQCVSGHITDHGEQNQALFSDILN
ncbi:UNVERIFIED_CONTAM: hypothetical protein FKN15_073849 [Acipenser sinensis]